ncbi:MAG: hypothetical protein HXS48_06870 [Theionarchaea archaeon]|nr:hypothetical protein [Theionarchaea archaeon]
MEERNKKYPEGHFIGKWMGIGVAIFAGFGIPLAIILKIPWIIAIGPAMGVAFGLAVGSSIESKRKKEGKIRPLTEDEKKKRKMLVIAGIMVFILGLVIFLLRLFL